MIPCPGKRDDIPIQGSFLVEAAFLGETARGFSKLKPYHARAIIAPALTRAGTAGA